MSCRFARYFYFLPTPHQCREILVTHVAQPLRNMRSQSRNFVAAVSQRWRSVVAAAQDGGFSDCWRARRAQPKSCVWVFSKQTSNCKKILIQPHSHLHGACRVSNQTFQLALVKILTFHNLAQLRHRCATAVTPRWRSVAAVVKHSRPATNIFSSFCPVHLPTIMAMCICEPNVCLARF